jgi:actin-related protein
MLDSVPLECLDDLCKNVVFAGGLWRVEGIQNYFKKQVSSLLPSFKKLQDLQVRSKLGFLSWGFNPSEVAWIGCSIGASVKNIDHLCLKRS